MPETEIDNNIILYRWDTAEKSHDTSENEDHESPDILIDEHDISESD